MNDLPAKLEAVAELARAGELTRLPRHLAQALPECATNVLAWHAAHGDGALAWCTECKRLAGKKHKCR